MVLYFVNYNEMLSSVCRWIIFGMKMSNKKQYLCTPASDDVMNRLLESFSKITNTTNNKKLEYEHRLDTILRIILDYLGVEHGSIMILEKKHLVVRAATRPEIIGHKQSLEKSSISAWVGKSGEPLFIQDIFKDTRFKSSSKGIYKDTELLSVPILLEDKVVGVVNVTDKTNRQGVLEDEIACLLQFSSLILSMLAQQKMQDDLKKQRNILRKKNKELKRQEAVREDLSRMLIHDLKGPLSDVVANLDILSYSIAEKNKQFLEAAQTGCDRAVQMVSNLVSVGKIEDGNMQLLKEKVFPGTLIDEALSSVKGMASLKDVTLKKEIQETIPFIRVDRILLLRVLQNLLNNALACSYPGTIIITGCKMVPQKKHIEFFVQDEGPGIAKEKQKVIFDKYASLSCNESGLVGTGLGLYFCRLAVGEHKGQINVNSKKGKGCRFYFSLPIW